MKSWSKPSKPWHLIFGVSSFYGFSHLFKIFQHISRCFTAQRAQGRATSPCRCTWQICPRPRGCGASAPSCWANARGRSRRRSGHWGRPCGRSSAPKLGGFLMVRERVYQSVCLSVYLYLSIYLSICLSVCLSICLSIYLSVYLSVCLSVYLSIYLSVCLSICLSVCLSICLSVYQSVYLSVYLSIYLSVYLSIYLSICLSVYLSICLSVYLSICLSVYLSICLSVYLSIYLSIWENFNDLTATSLESWLVVSRGNYPQMTLFQVGELFLIYPVMFLNCFWWFNFSGWCWCHKQLPFGHGWNASHKNMVISGMVYDVYGIRFTTLYTSIY